MKKQRNVTEFQKLSDHELEQVYGGISWANYLSRYLKEDYKYFLSDGSKKSVIVKNFKSLKLVKLFSIY